ncbi:MAG: aryl-sulfate sulfotransferase [Bacteroidota bacterium]
MKNNSLCLLIVGILLSFNSFITAQESGINFNSDQATSSYTLFKPSSDVNIYLVDNCGEVVNMWDNVFSPDQHAKLLPNGHLIYIQSNTIYERDWDGNFVRSVRLNDYTLRLRYELILLPNGNFLSVGRRILDSQGFIDLGYNIDDEVDPSQVDVVVEIDPDTEQIVWEWNIADHVIQQRDPNANNYGIISEHPELLNMDAISRFDWEQRESFMINGMGYNAELDQIALSVRKMSEVVIIDHTTTTQEAAGHTGGKYGKGGDILYRWGNPQNYGAGTSNDRFLFFQHNPHWIEEGPHKGKMTCYNNGLNRPIDTTVEVNYSNVPIINTPVDADGFYPNLSPGEAHLPQAPDMIIGPETNTPFFSGYTSGAHIFPNGNVFITEGVRGRIFEINPAGQTVWQYTVPFTWYIFRAEKYPMDYPAFMGKDLSPNGIVLGDTSTYDCQILTSVTNPEPIQSSFEVRYLDNRNVEVVNQSNRGFSYQLHDVQGKLIRRGQTAESTERLSFNGLPAGLYVLATASNHDTHWSSQKILIR